MRAKFVELSNDSVIRVSEDIISINTRKYYKNNNYYYEFTVNYGSNQGSAIYENESKSLLDKDLRRIKDVLQEFNNSSELNQTEL